jgi:hypothetical protein
VAAAAAVDYSLVDSFGVAQKKQPRRRGGLFCGGGIALFFWGGGGVGIFSVGGGGVIFCGAGGSGSGLFFGGLFWGGAEEAASSSWRTILWWRHCALLLGWRWCWNLFCWRRWCNLLGWRRQWTLLALVDSFGVAQKHQPRRHLEKKTTATTRYLDTTTSLAGYKIVILLINHQL